MNCQDSRILCNSFHGKKIAAPSDRHACTGVCAFFVVGVACTKQRAAREVSLKLRKLLGTRREQKSLPPGGRAPLPHRPQDRGLWTLTPAPLYWLTPASPLPHTPKGFRHWAWVDEDRFDDRSLCIRNNGSKKPFVDMTPHDYAVLTLLVSFPHSRSVGPSRQISWRHECRDSMSRPPDCYKWRPPDSHLL